MIKKIIALVATLLALWAGFHLFTLDKEVKKLDKISALIKSTAMEDSKLSSSKESIQPTQVPVQKSVEPDTSAKDKEVEDKLKALKNKAGNIAAFDVSPLYKKKCSSCHGNIGQGIIGPKLIGKSEEFLLKSLREFKSGERKNYVMYGLLGGMDDEQIAEIAKEVSTFQKKLDESKK
jgi:cytochrome c553